MPPDTQLTEPEGDFQENPSANAARWNFPCRCLLACLSGGIYALAYPPLGWRWLVIVGISGLLIALKGQRGTKARVIGFLHGMTAYAIGVSWLYHIFGAAVIVLWMVLAGFTALFAEMQSRVSSKGLGPWPIAIFTALNWCGWEFIRAELFPLKFPWMTAGLAMGPNSLLPWVGVYAVGFPVVLACVLLVIKKWKSAAVVILSLWLACFFCPRRETPAIGSSETVQVAGVQLEGVSLNEYVAATKTMPRDIDYVVWPEYSVPFDIRDNKRDWAIVRNLITERRATLTFGTQSRPGGGEIWRNIALTIDGTGERGLHTKVHRVHFFDDGIPGTTALPVSTDHGKVGTPVCFDGDFEDVFRRMAASGAEMFVVPTMDAEAWSRRQHDQHAELFRIRACENGRWVFVCATSGVSQIIDANGHVHTRLDALEQGVIQGLMKRESIVTFYTRFGWITPWSLLALAGIGWIWLVIPARFLGTVSGRLDG